MEDAEVALKSLIQTTGGQWNGGRLFVRISAAFVFRTDRMKEGMSLLPGGTMLIIADVFLN